MSKADEIEITPEMIEAGFEVPRNSGIADSLRELANQLPA
jgi:hypothetical protein